MRILIATGVYPPQPGGPSYYAQSLKEEFEKIGHSVIIRTYTIERYLPTGLRHLVYLLKTAPAYLRADFTLVLDTFSVGFPVAILKRIFGGTTIMRVGGDFLWEQYIERTGEKIVLSKFYEIPRSFTFKERSIFKLTKWSLSQMTRIVFNTTYQQKIWEGPYTLLHQPLSVVENCYYPKKESASAVQKNFVCFVRRLKWKNTDALVDAFKKAKQTVSDIDLDLRFDVPHEEVLETLRTCYAAILVSLGDISPNFVLEALSYGKPVILTKENGISDRIKDAALYVEPLSVPDITEKIVALSNEATYEEQKRNVAAFSFMHTYADIAKEFLAYANS